MKTKTNGHTYLWPLLIGVCILWFLVNLVLPDLDYSFVENRPLQRFPAPQAAQLEDGAYQQSVDEYVSDQMVGRNFFFHMNYLVRKLCNQKMIDDVFLGRGMLFESSLEPEGSVPVENMDFINRFAAASGLNCSLMIAPNAGVVQKDRLPLFAPEFTENELIRQIYSTSNIATLDVGSVLEAQKDEYIYYKTDHHWTSSGAGYAIRAWLGMQGIEPVQYDEMLVSTSFEGTLANKTGSIFLQDDIEIFVAQNNPEYVVTYSDGVKSSSIYDLNALDQKDQYQLFLGINQPVIQVNTNIRNGRSLMIFKDSYANCTIQFLLPYFENITIVDPRYYYEDIDYLIESNSISDVLFLFNYNTFVTDNSLQDVLNTYREGLDVVQSEVVEGLEDTEIY